MVRSTEELLTPAHIEAEHDSKVLDAVMNMPGYEPDEQKWQRSAGTSLVLGARKLTYLIAITDKVSDKDLGKYTDAYWEVLAREAHNGNTTWYPNWSKGLDEAKEAGRMALKPDAGKYR